MPESIYRPPIVDQATTHAGMRPGEWVTQNFDSPGVRQALDESSIKPRVFQVLNEHVQYLRKAVDANLSDYDPEAYYLWVWEGVWEDINYGERVVRLGVSEKATDRDTRYLIVMGEGGWRDKINFTLEENEQILINQILAGELD